MGWRLAKSLGKLRDQFDELAPNRKTDSDGTIGNEEHSARTSDHNPNNVGVVCALDITHDPAHGIDTYDIADQLRRGHDNRIKYLISNRRICGDETYAKRNHTTAWTWGHYSGVNPHDHHMHVSVDLPDYDKTDPWQFHLTEPTGTPEPEIAVLRRGSKGERVSYLQDVLGLKPADGIFGPITDAAVRAFQASHNLTVDGEVGPYTWRTLLEGATATPPVAPPVVPAPPIVPPIAPPTVLGPWHSGKGSWYSQNPPHWVDTGDAPGSSALGVPDNAQGVSFYDHTTLGNWFEVKAPNGKVSVEQQTDIGPHPRTNRLIDVSAVAAAERFGYTPQNFPTDKIWEWRPIEDPPQVAKLSEQKQATVYRDLRKETV